jgi:hypothetical protein
MLVICDHANTEHCKKVKKVWHGCWHSKPHDNKYCHTSNSDMGYFTCRNISGSIKVKCIPYKEKSK